MKASISSQVINYIISYLIVNNNNIMPSVKFARYSKNTRGTKYNNNDEENRIVSVYR